METNVFLEILDELSSNAWEKWVIKRKRKCRK
jgi:hypothetical protein